MFESVQRIALVGGIYGQTNEYRQRFQITPETTLESGLRARGIEVSTFSHQEMIEGDFDVIHVHHLGWGAVRAAVDCSPSALIFTPHNGKDMAGTLGFIHGKAMRLVMSRSDCIIALSSAEASFQHSRYDTSGAIHEIIPNGIDWRQYTMQRANQAGDGVPWRLLYVGQLDPLKRVDLLLRAVAQLTMPFILTLVYQNATLEPQLRSLTHELGITSFVDFLGMKGPHDLCGLYNRADLFVLPSDSEALPSVVTEAMLTGTPVIATDTGGVRVQMGGFGRVVPPNNLNALSQAIIETLQNYSEVQRTTGDMSRYARNAYSVDTMIDRHVKAYARAIKRPMKRRQRKQIYPMNALVKTAFHLAKQPLYVRKR